MANPFAADGSRLYRTGDLARFAPDGSLDFLGRADNQIKIRGMRLEIEDVEAGLAEHPAVRHSCVVARKNTAGGTYLVGYVIPAAGHEDLHADEVRAWADAHMVEYMVPTHTVVMKEFPLTANGKLDRAALPEPVTSAGPVLQPTTENERVVCAAVAAVLRLDEVGVDQDFFRLGGDSILAISLLSALRDAGLHVTARQIFAHGVVGALAAVASREDASTAQDDDVATGPVVGSPIVQWLGEVTDAVDGFVQSVVLNTPPELSAETLDRILTAVVRRHDMLRARLVRGERWSFDIPEAGETVAGWQESGLPLDACVELATAGLDPDHGVMLRAVWRREARELVVVVHHVVVDGVSWRVLMEDLATAWRQTTHAAHRSNCPRWERRSGAGPSCSQAPRSTRTVPTSRVPCPMWTGSWAGAPCPSPTPWRASGNGRYRSDPGSRRRSSARYRRSSTRASTTSCSPRSPSPSPGGAATSAGTRHSPTSNWRATAARDASSRTQPASNLNCRGPWAGSPPSSR